MGLILIFIIVLNVVAVALTYNCLSNLEKKERVIFLAVGIAIIYALTSFVYWISTKDVAIKEVSETGKNVITFLFVPINAIIVLPLVAISFNSYNIGRLKPSKLRNRAIIITILLVIMLVIECSYFKNIQNGIVDLIEKNRKQQNTQNIQQEYTSNEVKNDDSNIVDNVNEILENEIENNVENNIGTLENDMENVTVTENIIENEAE